MALRLVWPTIATTGTWSSLASYRPLSRWMAPGPDVAMHTPDPAGELGVPDGLEGGHLLVPGLDELRLVLGPAPRGQDAVDPVTGIGEHVPHVPGAQPLEQVISNRRCHVSSFRRRSQLLRSPFQRATHYPRGPRQTW